MARSNPLILATPTVDIGYNFDKMNKRCQNIDYLFFEILDEIDPELAKKLHDSTSSKPFTVSPLQAKYVRREGELFIPKGYRCWFRFTLLDDFIWSLGIYFQDGITSPR